MRLALLLALVAAEPVYAAGVTFDITLDPKLPAPPPGRLIVAVGRGDRTPRFTSADPPGSPVLGTAVEKFAPGSTVTLGAKAAAFPADAATDALPAGEYTVQAVFAFNRDINLPSAPGNLRSEPVRVRIDPAAGTAVKLTLSAAFPDTTPADTATHKYLTLPSKLLSDFHGRPMVYRVGVVLPADFDTQPDKKYPLVVRIGGFGQRSTSARRIAPDPRFVQILLDGAGPFGDPYQVNSANNGPYGDALVSEVIPHVEKAYRCVGTPKARFTTGGSTGGWVSLALQVFYPDSFNGCWSQCPDGVDFRAFQLIDIYADANAYRNRNGFERAARRTLDGDTVYTIRHECRLEQALGGRWELGGQQWASWNAVYGPKGTNGPAPLWAADGAIDTAVAKQWERYDLRLVLERNWATLGPKLAGKVNVWVGDADDYFLNNAVWRLRASLDKQTAPRFDGRIEIAPRRGHTSGWTEKQVLDGMAERAK